MQVFTNKENIGKLTKTSNTTVQLSSSTITLGAKQYSTSNLSCDPSVSGVGGLDFGSEQSAKYYYVYAVINSGSVVLVCSLSNQKPSGYSTYKKVGAFVNDFDGNVEQVLNIGEQPKSKMRYDTGVSASTNNRSITFSRLLERQGIDIVYSKDAALGDTFTVNKEGSVRADAVLLQNVNNQEIGILLNYNDNVFLSTVKSTNPENVFCMSRSVTSGVASHTGGSDSVSGTNSYRAYVQIAGGSALTQDNEMSLYFESSNSLDWS